MKKCLFYSLSLSILTMFFCGMAYPAPQSIMGDYQLFTNDPTLFFKSSAPGHSTFWFGVRDDANPENDKLLFGLGGDKATGEVFSLDKQGNLVAASMDTGQGPTEIYLMNQDLRSIDSPSFVTMTLSGNLDLSGAINGVVVSSGTDTFNISKGTASIDVAPGALVDINYPLTVEATVTIGADVNALEALSGFGLIARTGANAYSERTIQGDDNISVENGDGVAGNPGLTLVKQGDLVPGSGLIGGADDVLPGADTDVIFSHADTSSQASVEGSGRTYIQDILLDEFGHVYGLVTAIETVVDTWRGVDDTPVDGEIDKSITSNWAYAHANASNPHGIVETDPVFTAWNKSTGITITESQISDLQAYLLGNETITLSGDATGSGATEITVTVVDDSHNHIIANIDGLQTALDGLLPIAGNDLDLDGTTFNIEPVLNHVTQIVRDSGDITFSTTTSGDIILNPAENVGIGKTPFTKLDVDGVITATGGNSTSWNTAYGWGDHAEAGYLTSYTETDPVFTAWDKSTGISVTESQISDLQAYLLGNETITLSGDATGSGATGITVTVVDDSHNHTASTISGLGVGDFSSANISQWTNNSGYITDGNTNWDNSYGYITSSGSITGDAGSVDGQSFAWSNSDNTPVYFWAANSSGSAFLASRTATTVGTANNALALSCTGCVAETEISQNTLDDSEIQDNSLTAGSLAANSVGDSELIASPTFTNPVCSTPTSSTHVANKAYVDSVAASTSYIVTWSTVGTNNSSYYPAAYCPSGWTQSTSWTSSADRESSGYFSTRHTLCYK